MRLYKRTWTKKDKDGNDKTVEAWCYDLTIEGKRKRKCGFDKMREAEEAADKLKADAQQGLDISKESTFKEYYRQWVTAYKKDEITDSAFQTYINALNQFIEYFGEDKKLATLNRIEYKTFINWYADTHTQESTRKVHNCIKAALNDAQYEGYILKNPAYKIKFTGKKETQSEDVKYIERDDFLKLKDHLKSKTSKSALLLYILMITGARFSEINNLKYIDIKNDGIDITEGKTKNAVRFISVPQEDIKHITDVLNMHTRKIKGDVFKLSSNAAIKTLDNALDHCKIKKRITPHALRHSHCSILLSEGMSIYYVSKRLGHANIAITMEVYSHLLEEQFKNENEKTVEFLNSI